MKQKDKDLIRTMINQAKSAGYKPTDIWLVKDGKIVIVTTDGISLSKYAKRLGLKFVK
ncbi:MAG: hypothetical protein IMZ64_01735 [Bacteroidetes bacterium]|nr:hypothetical protein [Bacteroidota bacterium]